MAYDDDLADRIRPHVRPARDVTEKRMFGGLAFLLNGNMAVAASSRGGMLVRVDPEQSASLVEQDHVERMIMQGREMDGWLRVGPEALEQDADLERWVRTGVDYASRLPPK